MLGYSLRKRDSIEAYLRLARLDKPWGMVLLAWPTLSSLVLTQADLNIWWVFLVGIVLTRSAGCVINDYADRWLDHQVKRTQKRPLVSNQLTAKQALWFFVLLMLMAASLLYFLNQKARYLAVLSAVFLCVYPYTKRYIKAPQLFLGVVFSMGVPMVYVSQDKLDQMGIFFFLLSVYWVVVYDTLYAMTDMEDDIKTNVGSLAIALGEYREWFVMLSYGLIWGLWGIWGYWFLPSFLWVWIPLGLNYYHQCLYMKKKQYFKSFLLNQSAGLMVFGGIVYAKMVGSAWIIG